MPSLIEQIESDLTQAMKNREIEKVSVLRLLKNALKNAAINGSSALTPEEEIKVAKKQAKDLKETIDLYEKNNQPEAALKEKKELEIIQAYLPEELTDAEIIPIIDKAIEEVRPQGLADLGKVMGKVMPELKDKVDGSRLANLIKEKLS